MCRIQANFPLHHGGITFSARTGKRPLLPLAAPNGGVPLTDRLTIPWLRRMPISTVALVWSEALRLWPLKPLLLSPMTRKPLPRKLSPCGPKSGPSGSASVGLPSEMSVTHDSTGTRARGGGGKGGCSLEDMR